MINDDLNLKTQVKINDVEHLLELFSINRGEITEIKLDNRLFIINNGQEHHVSHENPGVTVEKPEQKPPILEQNPPEHELEPLKTTEKAKDPEDPNSQVYKIRQQSKFKTISLQGVAVKQECIDYLKQIFQNTYGFSNDDFDREIRVWYRLNMDRKISDAAIQTYRSSYMPLLNKQKPIKKLEDGTYYFVGKRRTSKPIEPIEKTCYKWTNEKIDFLKENYHQKTAKEIGKKLNISPNLVYDKAGSLGLKKYKTIKTRINTPSCVKGFTEHVNRRAREIRERERLYNKKQGGAE